VTEPDELLRKADALLGRYKAREESANATDFPTLTEVVEASAKRIAPESPVGQPPLVDADDDGKSTSPPDDETWRAEIAAQIFERLAPALDAIASQLRADLDAIVHAAVQDALSRSAPRRDRTGRG
jgi:hypothetical protein